MISLRARLVRYMARQYFKRIGPDSDIEELQASWEYVAGKMKPARGVRVREATVAGIECEWLVPEGCDERKVLLYLHGGAYLMGSARTHRRMVSFIARASGVRALVPNYRLAPEHRFPAALRDAVAVCDSLLTEDSDVDHLAVAGDSAGGGLAMALLLSRRDAGQAPPAAACLLSPWLDLSGQGESMVGSAELDPLFRPQDMQEIVQRYCDPEDVRNPLVSPVYAAAHDLPPLLIQVGDHEILLSDATRMSDRIEAAGGNVELQVWPGMWHVWQYFVGQMPESGRAIDQIGAFLRRELAAGDAAAEPPAD
ncbi:MAG: alpha/beta hydrolase [Gammaproteobacteria bacterium]|nr:MAG: alpha/beta hydrolase [Gammaproteobacteria bacterium]